jgi:hypothetical protein
MKPKEKAKELIDKFTERTWVESVFDGWVQCVFSNKAKEHALNAIDIVIDELTKIPYGIYFINRLDYWNKVKEEIKKL